METGISEKLLFNFRLLSPEKQHTIIDVVEALVNPYLKGSTEKVTRMDKWKKIEHTKDFEPKPYKKRTKIIPIDKWKKARKD